MKPLFIAAAAILLIIAAGLAGCGPDITQMSDASKPNGSREFTRVGEVMLHVDFVEEVPDAYIKAGFLRTTRRGISAVYAYMGLNPAQQPKFRRRDVDIVTMEAPHRSPAVQQSPEKKEEFALDYREGRHIALRDRTIEIIDATPAGVTFTIHSQAPPFRPGERGSPRPAPSRPHKPNKRPGMVNAGLVNVTVRDFLPAGFCESSRVFGRIPRSKIPFKYTRRFNVNHITVHSAPGGGLRQYLFIASHP